MSANNQYPQPYGLMNQSVARPMQNMMPMGMQAPLQFPYQPQMPNRSAPRTKNMIQPAQQMMMTSPYEAQIMNPYMTMPHNMPPGQKSMSKSRTSLIERQSQQMVPQQKWYPQQTQMNTQFMMNQNHMNGYGQPGINQSRNQQPQATNFYQPPQQYLTSNIPYQQIPVGYNAGAQNYRPQNINTGHQQSSIPQLPMIVNPPLLNQQMLQNSNMMNNSQMNSSPYRNYEGSNSDDRPQSSQRISRPSSASSHVSSSGLNIPNHSSSFRTGINKSAKGGRRTPVEKRPTLTTHERYMKNSRGSLAALDYETYDLDDWRRQKTRDGNMKLPTGLGHTETHEWKNKVMKRND